MRIYSFLRRFGIDYFILALLAMVVLAYLFPAFGTNSAWYAPASLSGYGVALIFFFYGVKLSPQQLRSGMSNFSLHIVVQLSTFVLFPLLALLLKPALAAYDIALWQGVFFLAAIPSTVSSSVVMVGMARGNVPAAIFNASISSLIGLVMTPLLIGFGMTLSGNAGGMSDMSSILFKLLWQVILPVFAGTLLHRYLGKFALKYQQWLKYFDQMIILTIIYTSFSSSFEAGIFAHTSWTYLLLLGLGMLVLLGIVYQIIAFICRKLAFNREDSITAIFCGSKKSLVHGTVFSKVLFPASTTVGMLLLPLMLFHAIQLIVISMVAQQMAREKTQEN